MLSSKPWVKGIFDQNLNLIKFNAIFSDFVQNTHLLGQMVWPNAQILGHWMVLNKDLFKGKTVLELGAGPGTRFSFL